MADQAKRLREKMNSPFIDQPIRQTRVIAVTSGKGGVGKSNFSLNFALSLIKQKKRVLIFDVDLGFANIEVLLGFNAKESIITMLEKELSIWEVIEQGPEGLLFISGGSGFSKIFEMDDDSLNRFFQKLSQLQGFVDYILLDTGAGISNMNMRYILSADDVFLVTTPEPTAIADAYSVVKMVHGMDRRIVFNLIVNRCINEAEGELTAKKLQLVSQQFLNKQLEILGYVMDDPKVSKAVKKQEPFLLAYPYSDAAASIQRITQKYLNQPISYKLGIKGFLMKMAFKR